MWLAWFRLCARERHACSPPVAGRFVIIFFFFFLEGEANKPRNRSPCGIFCALWLNAKL